MVNFIWCFVVLRVNSELKIIMLVFGLNWIFMLGVIVSDVFDKMIILEEVK